ncbi:MAG: hypothetical protein ACC657_05205 [Thiohalomonadales bacterium]
MKFSLYLFFSLVFLSSSVANAGPFYVEADVMATRVDVNGTEFDIFTPKIKLGYIILPQVLFELQYSGSGEKEKDYSNMKIKSISAAYIKLGSKPDNKLRAFITLGVAETSLEITGQNAISDKYASFSGGLAFEYLIGSKNNYFTAEYNAFYNNEDVTIMAVSLGYRHTF